MQAPVVPAVAQVLGVAQGVRRGVEPEVPLAVAAACNAVVGTSAAATSAAELNAVGSDKVCRPHPEVPAPETHTRMLVRVRSVMQVPGESITMPLGVEQAVPPAVSDYDPVRVPDQREPAERAARRAASVLVLVRGQALPELGSRGPVLQVRVVPRAVSAFVPVQVRAPPEPVSPTPVVQEAPPAELVCVPVQEQARLAWAVPPAVSVFDPAQVPVLPESVSARRESAALPAVSAIFLERVPAPPEPPGLTSTRTQPSPHKRRPSEPRPFRPTVPLSIRAIPTPGMPTIGLTVRSTTIRVTGPLPRPSGCPVRRCCMTTVRTWYISLGLFM